MASGNLMAAESHVGTRTGKGLIGTKQAALTARNSVIFLEDWQQARVVIKSATNFKDLMKSKSGAAAASTIGVWLLGALIVASMATTVFLKPLHFDIEWAAPSNYPVQIPFSKLHAAASTLPIGDSSKGIPEQGHDASLSPNDAPASNIASSPVGTDSMSEFERAFLDLGRRAAPSSGPRGKELEGLNSPMSQDGLLQVDFDLNHHDAPADVISKNTKVFLDGKFLGKFELLIRDTLNIAFVSNEILPVIDEKVSKVAQGRVEALCDNCETVTFEQMRSIGFQVRYDAANDRVMVASGSPN